MRFEEDCINDYHCIVDTVQNGKRRDYISLFLSRKASLKEPERKYYEKYIQPSFPAVLRFISTFAGIVACGIGLMVLLPEAEDISPLGFMSVFLSLILSITIICFNLMVIPIYGDETRKKVFSIIWYSEAGVLFLCGIVGRFKDIHNWVAVNVFLILCFVDIFFLACLVMILTERKNAYKIEKKARCTGYVRLIHESISSEGNAYGIRYYCRISPIFEYDSARGPVKVCYDEFTRSWNSMIPLGSAKIHISDEDMYMVQPEVGLRVLVFSVLLVVFSGLTILSFCVI